MLVNEKLNNLITKYNVNIPRYTSYPTAVQFANVENVQDLRSVLEQRKDKPTNLSLYIHLPFCRQLCWYCGCTRVITGNQQAAERYLDYLERELNLLKLTLHTGSVLEQIHFGGGTPNFLNAAQLLRLGMLIKDNFQVANDVEYSAELDPRTLTEDQVQVLRQIGCNRASLGIQDINPEVQLAIHRVQTDEQNFKAIDMLRSNSISAINLDLIYGLPKQTEQSFVNTLEQVLKLGASRLALYSYAHLPQIMPAQRLFSATDLPTADQKFGMLTYAIEFLTQNGYQHIGMDHFARSEDALSVAMQSGKLHRNFQGYSTKAGLEMLALGMSAISERGYYYYQNSKKLDDYYQRLDSDELPIIRSLKLSAEDMLRRQLIASIMCGNDIVKEGLSLPEQELFGAAITQHWEKLSDLQVDGLIELSNTKIKITKLGRLFLRNIAVIFDGYVMSSGSQTYSRAV